MNIFYRRTLIIVICVIILLFVFFIFLRSGLNNFVADYIDNKVQSIEQQYNISIPYEGIEMKGMSGVEIKNIAVIPSGSDTLVSAGSFFVKLNLEKLFFSKAEISGMEINDLNLNFITKGSHSNFDFIFGKDASSSSEKEKNYSIMTEQILNFLFKMLPRDASLHNLRISYQDDKEDLAIDILHFIIEDHRFATEIISTENGIKNEWICKGFFLEEEQKIDIRLYAKENNVITLPFIKHRWGSTIQVDTLAFELKAIKNSPDLYTLKGKAGVKGLTVYDDRIATEKVILNRGFINYNINIGKNFIELNNNTTVYFNKLKLNPYIKAEKNKDWHIIASLDKKDFPANDFFESIPKGFFRHIEGLEADGTLTYHFFLDVDMTNVERLKFESTLNSRNFRILKYGNTDLRLMNEPFKLTIYEKERPVRTFILGSENPDFRTYGQISRYLPYAIMHGEDAGFFSHKGFLQDAFRRSLVQNIQENRFARGGSTLSMQVVKNVFLSRNKTIARKLEEIMIVWLIETNKLTSKRRMFEVYMNVIEWGPNVYGITEAARFYFNKEPSTLSLTECVFLAYILPAPKRVKSHFNGLQIKPAFYLFYYDAVKRLYQRNWISYEERARSNPNLMITGPAMEYLLR